MDTIKFEELLEKHLSEIKKTVGSNFRKSGFEEIKIHLYFSQHFNMNFHGMFSHVLSLETDENDIIKSITVHFNKVIDHQSYNSFVEKYGEPNHIYVLSNIKVVKEKTSSNDYKGADDLSFHQNVTKREGDLIEGKLEDKPLAIVWEKDGYYIQAYLRHEQNISEVMFSIDNPSFNVKPNKEN